MTQQENERINHQQNLSINSVSSIVEPLTPPDYGDSFNHGYSNTDKYLNGQVIPSSTPFGNGNANKTNSTLSSGVTPSTPLSSLNTNIGGNTFRSRFKSVPLVTELDQKFNQFNINSLQVLSHNQSHYVSSAPQSQSQPQQQKYYSPSPSSNNSTSNSSNSIPQIPLQQFLSQNVNPSTSNLQPQRHRSQPTQQNNYQPPTQKQRFSSLPTIQPSQKDTLTLSSNTTGSSSSNTSSSNYKNYDELNLIPIEHLDILKLSVDQYGCRYLQKKLESDSTIKDVIFNKIFNKMIDLVVDPFGNYLIQKLVDYLTTYQKDLMVEKIHPYLYAISINQYGTRSLQKIIDKITDTYQMDLVVKGLQMNDTTSVLEDNNIVKLIKDLNGNHVIQRCIFKFPPEKFQFIIDSICFNNNIVRISTHKHGCCVLQKLLNNASFTQILKISQVLLIYLDDLINDQFGNYIIQFLFELNFLKTSDDINFLIDEFFNKIYKNLVRLSCLKFSSNVIEKFIKILKFKQNYVYLNELIKVINMNFETLIKDKFGNYVIQTLIDQFYDVNELNFEMSVLIHTVKNYLPVIKAAPYARKIQLKIQQLESSYSTSSVTPPNTFSSRSSFTSNSAQAGFEPNYLQPNQYLNYNNGNYTNRYNHNPYFPNDPSFYNNQGNNGINGINGAVYDTQAYLNTTYN